MLSYVHKCSRCFDVFMVHPEQAKYTQVAMAVALGNTPELQSATHKCGYTTKSTLVIDDNKPICFTYMDRVRAEYFRIRLKFKPPFERAMLEALKFANH